MHLLVGLGNIGKEYEKTRHNFGFLALDEIIQKFSLLGGQNKFSSTVFSGVINEKKVLAIKPQTYMNRSGIAVLEACNFYKIPPENVIVFHDEIDIKLGEIRIKQGGGNAGHNGLKSIDGAIGKNYHRFRLGVGRPSHENQDVADYVLSKFSKEEQVIVDEVCVEVAKSVGELFSL
jgi:PTH1 family peptidyl-tRNA hydrolase